MAQRIEDYGLIGDTQTAALIGNDGSLDWLCLPRFDSDACFAALLGAPEHGHWRLAPRGRVIGVERKYRGDTLILETDFHVKAGVLRVTDAMPPRGLAPEVLRIAKCLKGRVDVESELAPRFGYGVMAPWVRTVDRGATLVAGPDALRLTSPVPVEVREERVLARFALDRGQSASFVLTWHPSHEPPPPEIDPSTALDETMRFWGRWADRCAYEGPWRNAVIRSLITLKALTYSPTGGIVAAPTTSLPERLGGERNWDYRFCWVRDATFSLQALIESGYLEEADAWREWLLRAAAGHPGQLQVLYGVAGERRLTEMELPWLPGFEGSCPVRIGNAASHQLQHDVPGELLDCMYQARAAGLAPRRDDWILQRAVLDHLASSWTEPDEGIWEVRSGPRHFTHSKMMAWVAFDRGVATVERFGMKGPVKRWRELRDRIHAEVCEKGFDHERGVFVQAYGSKELDASLLMMPLVGFLPSRDRRVRRTVRAIERELTENGFVRRYRSEHALDGLSPGEGFFLPCSFWLADCLALLGRQAEACALMERLLALRNDLGLLSEEYDGKEGRMLGNFPQAFSHVALVNLARNLAHPTGGTRRARGAFLTAKTALHGKRSAGGDEPGPGIPP